MRVFLILILITGFCLRTAAQNDTLNKTDANNLKQGWWITYDASKTRKTEEGKYTDSKKVGIWKSYYESGQLKSEITYVDNKPDGYAKFYYDNGIVSEEGTWKGNRWVGNYKYYHKNGNPSYEWSYNDQGKRTGNQKYYHENGQLMIEGDWNDGKEQGTIKEYDDTGKLVSEKTFNDGKLDENSVKVYNNAAANNDNNNSNNNVPVKDTVKTVSNNNNQVNNNNPLDYLSDGFHRTFTKDKKLDKEGTFKGGKFIEGKKYIYDDSGKLAKTLIYKNGEIVDTVYPK